MKLTVLGNNGPFPGPGGACSGYLVQEENVNILLDCGSGVLSNLQKFTPFEQLDAVILTHLHSDHMSDMLVLRYALQIKRARNSEIGKLKVYAPSEPADQFELLKSVPDFEVYEITADTSLDIGGIKITFGSMRHPFKCYGVCMEYNSKKFVYSGDTSWDEGILSFFENADLLLLDAGLMAKDKKSDNVPHLTADECGKVAGIANVKRLLLTHFSPLYKTEDLLEEAKRNFGNTETSQLLKSYNI